MTVPGLDPGIIPVIHVVKQMDVFRLAGNGAAWMAGTSPICANLDFIVTHS